jgi:hypothetical protein
MAMFRAPVIPLTASAPSNKMMMFRAPVIPLPASAPNNSVAMIIQLSASASSNYVAMFRATEDLMEYNGVQLEVRRVEEDDTASDSDL